MLEPFCALRIYKTIKVYNFLIPGVILTNLLENSTTAMHSLRPDTPTAKNCNIKYEINDQIKDFMLLIIIAISHVSKNYYCLLLDYI